MKCGHLFNGIGGFALAASWMGWENIMHCEIDPFCNKVMNYHFPNSYQHEDIRTTDFTIWGGRIDLITGGDPCQPHSGAGSRKGKDDDRYLWPEYLRAVEEIQPKWIVNENVPGSVSNGILDQMIIDLENAGYSWWPPFIIPAGAVGALHRRDRVWLVAYSDSKRQQKRDITSFSEIKAQGDVWDYSQRFINDGPITGGCSIGEILRAANGVPEQLAAGIRNSGIKAMGNAIVPQIAFAILKAIEKYENDRP
jgi:DNA (cytosine-5)-methyltransferase 1